MSVYKLLFARPAVFPIVIAGIFMGGCASAGGTSWVELAGRRFTVEIADEPSERARGLMFRESMPNDRGMLFIHDEESQQAYWMKNTKISLDILYFDNDRKLVTQQRDIPPCSLGDACPSYPSEGRVRYVLELNAGLAAEMKLEDGVELTIDPKILPAR